MALSPAAMITAIETALEENPIGVVEVRYPDGRTVKFDRNQALSELARWQNKKSMQAGGGLTMARMQLKGDA